MKRDRKARASQLVNDLQRSTAFEVVAIKELVNLLYEDAKHKLVMGEGDNLLRLQGEARALQRLYEDLTTPSPVLNREQ